MNNPFSKSPIQVTLSKDQLEDLIREKVREAFPGFDFKSMKVKVRTVTDMRGESCGTEFDGVCINLSPVPGVPNGCAFTPYER